LDINSKADIAEAVKTLEGFSNLRRLRHEAHYKNGESLTEYVVLGRWFLDSCGNCMGAESPFAVEPVLTKHEFFDAVGQDKGVGFGLPTSIPKPEDECSFCHLGWSIKNIHDCYRKESLIYHIQCYRIKLAIETRKTFESAFITAGYGDVFANGIDNEYYNDPSAIYYTHWFRVSTSLANFKVGWRKRVIHLEILDPVDGFSMHNIFTDEDTTKDNKMIHCWGLTKMAAYLHEIKFALLLKRSEKLFGQDN